MKYDDETMLYHYPEVAPVRERGLKFCCGEYGDLNRRVAPVRERGLKLPRFVSKEQKKWVAPVRERGLKCLVTQRLSCAGGRSLP